VLAKSSANLPSTAPHAANNSLKTYNGKTNFVSSPNRYATVCNNTLLEPNGLDLLYYCYPF